MVKTAVGSGDADAQAFIYMATVLKSSVRTALGFQTSVERALKAVSNARNVMASLEQYYFDFEADLRWEDEGGACDG